MAYDRFFLSDENTIANPEVFNEVVVRLQVKLNLEMAASVLLCSLRVLVRDHKVVHYSLLQSLNSNNLTMVVCS